MQHQQRKEEEESNNNRPDSEHGDREASRSPPGTPPPSKRKPEGDLSSEGTPPKNQGLIKAKGTYYPLTAFPTNMPQGPVMRRVGESPPREQVTSGILFIFWNSGTDWFSLVIILKSDFWVPGISSKMGLRQVEQGFSSFFDKILAYLMIW